MSILSTVIQNLQMQRKMGEFCDIKLILENYSTWIHSAIVCPLSLLLKSAFLDSKPTPSKSNRGFSNRYLVKIKLNNNILHKCSDCLDKIIDFIYGQHISINSTQHILHIENLCAYLNLSECIVSLLKEHLKINSLKQFLPPADKEQTLLTTPTIKCIKNELDEMSPPEFNTDIILEHSIPDSPLEYFIDSEKHNYHSNTKLPTGKTHNCIECDAKYYKTNDLLNHLLQTGHGNTVCSLCWIDVKESTKLFEHIELHCHPKPFFCSYCSSRFQTRSLLGQHLPSHLIQRPFTCEICHKSFKTKHSLNCHSESHSKEKKFLCDECGFSTVHSRMLKAHKLIHSGKLFKCPITGCHQTSTIKQNMEQHISTHNKNQSFVCELCGHKFTQSKSLKRHSMIHSNEEGSNNCLYCPFKARRMDNLKAHILRQHAEKSKKFKP